MCVSAHEVCSRENIHSGCDERKKNFLCVTTRKFEGVANAGWTPLANYSRIWVRNSENIMIQTMMICLHVHRCPLKLAEGALDSLWVGSKWCILWEESGNLNVDWYSQEVYDLGLILYAWPIPNDRIHRLMPSSLKMICYIVCILGEGICVGFVTCIQLTSAHAKNATRARKIAIISTCRGGEDHGSHPNALYWLGPYSNQAALCSSFLYLFLVSTIFSFEFENKRVVRVTKSFGLCFFPCRASAHDLFGPDDISRMWSTHNTCLFLSRSAFYLPKAGRRHSNTLTWPAERLNRQKNPVPWFFGVARMHHAPICFIGRCAKQIPNKAMSYHAKRKTDLEPSQKDRWRASRVALEPQPHQATSSLKNC